MMIAGILTFWLAFKHVANIYRCGKKIAAKLPPYCRYGTGLCAMRVLPETKN